MRSYVLVHKSKCLQWHIYKYKTNVNTAEPCRRKNKEKKKQYDCKTIPEHAHCVRAVLTEDIIIHESQQRICHNFLSILDPDARLGWCLPKETRRLRLFRGENVYYYGDNGPCYFHLRYLRWRDRCTFSYTTSFVIQKRCIDVIYIPPYYLNSLPLYPWILKR